MFVSSVYCLFLRALFVSNRVVLQASKKATAALSSSTSQHDQPMAAAAAVVAPSVSGPSVVASSRAQQLLSGGGKQAASAHVSVQRARSSGRATVVHSETVAAEAAPVPESKKRAATESTLSRSVELRSSKRLKSSVKQ
jgi:hypothetical protein